ncbi:MAG: sel1 repeat family protein [Magnetococcales bacterium]|nr:sel1 repeat family protein [Magnetococcales bacterium]
MKRFLFLVMVLFLLVIAGNAGFCDDSSDIVRLREKAEEGDANSQYSLGNMYKGGRGGLYKDCRQAAYWYRKAADQNHLEAQINLGISYATGHGVPKDDGQALAWYRKAADQGHVGAQYILGVFYTTKSSNSDDDKKAVEWYRKAAEQGHTQAQYNLGVFYETGRGVPMDNKQAVSWYRKTASFRQ